MAKRKSRGKTDGAAEDAGLAANGAQGVDTTKDAFDEWIALRNLATRVRTRVAKYKREAAQGPKAIRALLRDLEAMTG